MSLTPCQVVVIVGRRKRLVNNYENDMPENPTKDVFTERLKTARQVRGLGQAELAARSGLPTTSISHFESGNRKPSFDNLRRLAKALDASTDYLLGRVAEIGGTGAVGDQLYRDVKNLSGRDREIAEDFMKILASRSEPGQGTKE